MVDILFIADAYLQGVFDSVPKDERHCVDTWWATEKYDINVDGSDYHGLDEDVLCVYVYRVGDYTGHVYMNRIS